MTPFEVKDCALLSRMSGLPPAFNLRELRERIAVCSENVLFHHFRETTLRGSFDDPMGAPGGSWSRCDRGDHFSSAPTGPISPRLT